MNVELVGGPHDGQTMAVPAHLLHVRIPVPDSAQIRHPPFDTQTKPRSSFWVASYERWAWVQGKTLFKYQGQEQITG